MGITWRKDQTPGGHEVMHSTTSGPVSADDVRGYLAQLEPGGALYQKSLLSVIESDTSYSPEARMLVRGIDASNMPDVAFAIVVKSAPQRIVLGFMLHFMSRMKGMKVFGEEAEAVRWLDETLAKRRAGAPMTGEPAKTARDAVR